MKKLTAGDPETMSPDLHAANLERLKALFPELVTEGPDGAVVNVDVLKALVGDNTVTDADEKYGLNWHGKRQARRLALTPSSGTLLPCPEESEQWGETQNLLIEGDNLEVLKLLQKSYSGSVKLIYIDPPYNTGKDFIYKDKFDDGIMNYLELTGQAGEGGIRLSTNTETSGRFHTNWLNMLYPRLLLARDLLREDGLAIISIDDNEASRLCAICDEVFGEENRCAQFVWNTEGNTDNQYLIKVNHEYIIAYYKNVDYAKNAIGHVIDPNTPVESNLWKGIADNNINKNNPANPPSVVELPAGFPCSEETLYYRKKEVDEEFFEQTQADGFISDDVKLRYNIESKSGLPVKLDDLIVADHKLSQPCRIYVGMANRNKLLEFIDNNCEPVQDGSTMLRFYLNINAGVRYARENDKPRNILSVLRGFGTTEKTRTYLKSLGLSYDYAKPVKLIEYLVRVGCEENGIVMDFFAGSGTTAEAVVNLNIKDGAMRKFICVQLPERITDRRAGGATTLADISKQRVVKILKQARESYPLYSGDLGFRLFKLDSSNIRAWEPDPNNLDQTILDYTENIKEDRTELDILYELLLKLGLDLCVPIEQKEIAGKSVHSIGGGVLMACLSPEISLIEVEPLALGLVEWHQLLAPAGDTTCVFRDSAFKDDVAKTNLTAILNQHGLATVRSL